MDQKELQEKIALYYSKLPPKAQEVFSGMAWLETLKAISQKYGLTEKQIETLGTETTLVLLGIIHLVEYEEALTNELGLPRNSTDKMVQEIQESIIKEIRPELLIAFEANQKEETEPPQATGQKLDKRFENLPSDIKEIVEKANYQPKLYEIAKEYKLTVTQMGFLDNAVGGLIVGSIHPEEFQVSLEKNLGLPSETVGKLVNDINEKIFLKIRELLKNSPLEEYPTSVGGGGQTYPPRPSATPQEGNNNDTHILNSVGIEIIPEKLELAAAPAEKQAENREDILKKIEKPETVKKIANGELRMANNAEIHPILAQKLSGSFQISSAKTDHTLQNLSSSDNTVTAKNTSKIDPYREIPE